MIDQLTHISQQPAALSPAELSSLLDMVQAQIEYHQAEIARLRPILHRLQSRIPTDCFSEFINALEEI